MDIILVYVYEPARAHTHTHTEWGELCEADGGGIFKYS